LGRKFIPALVSEEGLYFLTHKEKRKLKRTGISNGLKEADRPYSPLGE